jgi:hypothetical protein
VNTPSVSPTPYFHATVIERDVCTVCKSECKPGERVLRRHDGNRIVGCSWCLPQRFSAVSR